VTDFNIHEQRGEVIQNAEHIVNIAPPAKDHRRLGIDALRGRHYRTAATHLKAAVEADPGDPSLHFYLALALLQGVRPNRHSRESILEIQRQLKEADRQPRARALSALVAEDYGLTWRRYPAVSGDLLTLVVQTSPAEAAEIVLHVPAREARTWQQLVHRSREWGA